MTKTKTTKNGRHYGLPIETVLDHCSKLHDEGLTVETTVYRKDGSIDTRRTGTFTADACEKLSFSVECPCDNDECPGKAGDWVWIDTNLQQDATVRDVLKAIGFEFTGKNAAHPKVWANSCQKPVRYKRKGKGKSGSGKAADEHETETPRKAVSDFMKRLKQQRNQAS